MGVLAGLVGRLGWCPLRFTFPTVTVRFLSHGFDIFWILASLPSTVANMRSPKEIKCST